jgi:hypothetical protein
MWYLKRGPSPTYKSHPGARMSSPKRIATMVALHLAALQTQKGFSKIAEMIWWTAETCTGK